MLESIKICLCLVAIGACFVTSSGQAPHDKRIDEINAAKLKVRKLVDDAELNRTEAGKANDKSIEEAARLYAEASDVLNEAADKLAELAKLKTPAWYGEYFSLQAKLFRNLATLGASANEELLTRKNGPPSETLEQSWKKDLERILKENDEFRRQIKKIESREGVVLIKE